MRGSEKEVRAKVGEKELCRERERLGVRGKGPKETLESREEMRQKEKGDAGQEQGRNPW